MTKLNLELLGGFRLQTDAGELVPLPTKKARALLAYLALHPGQAQARPKLAALLWGDHGEAQARDSLRQALSLVRKALAPAQVLTAGADTVTFEPTDLSIDAIGFERLVAQTEPVKLEEAAGLYRGEFLEGFQVQAPEFEGWATAERQRLRERALEAFTKLLDRHLAEGAIERGIHVAARLLAVDPIQERAHRTLMELYRGQGRYAAALRQYRTCAELLAKELGIEPDAATKDVYRDILRRWNQRQNGTLQTDPSLPPERANELDREPPTAPPPSLERRRLTVVVCDLVGISRLSAQLDPEELQALLAAYHRCCAKIVSQSGGAVEKLSGAEVLAYFGYPQAHEHDAERAVRAGLALVEAVSKLDAGQGPPLQARVGIATGSTVLGDLAGNGADQGGLVGEAVHLAARLQALAAPDAVAIASSTRQLVGALFEYDEVGAVLLEGFSEPVAAWRVWGASTVESRFEALRAMTTPLVGREEELELLRRRWEQAKRGDGRVVLLSGEPGIGKSRLAEALLEQLAVNPRTHLRFFCSPHHQDSALHPTITQLERAAGFRREDTVEQRLDKLEELLAQATDNLGEAIPLVAELLCIPTAGRYKPLDLSPQRRRQHTLAALLAQIEGLAARQPVLIVFEDAQWIDPTSLEALDLLVDRVPSLPLLLIITFRPEFAPPWVGRSQVSALGLNRLARQQSEEMVAAVAGAEPLTKDVAAQIVERSDGIPLFVEELTKAVLESGIPGVDRDKPTESVSPPTIPTTLYASLLARLDRLAPVRGVAQIGACLGRQFSHELIGAVAQMPRAKLDDALRQLVAAELLYRRGSPPDAEYTFKHALVQETAYGTLLRSRRQQIHACIAATLEEQFSEIVWAQPALLAQHCAEAGLAEKAIVYWLKAGEQAKARSAMTEAVALLQKGLDLLSQLPDGPWRQQQELDLQIALGPALSATKGYSSPDVGDSLARARTLAEQIDRPEYVVPLLSGQWLFHLIRSEYKLALSIAEQIEKVGEARNDVVAQLLGRYDNGCTRFFLGEFVAARTLLDRCHGLGDPAYRAVRAGLSEDPYAMTLLYLAVTLAYLGYIDQARSRLDEVLSEARRLRQAFTLAVALSQSNWIGAITCSPEMRRISPEMERNVKELAALSTERDFPQWLGWATAQRGWSLTALGQAHEGLSLLAQGLMTLRVTGGVACTPIVLMWLAEAHAILGQPVEGLNCLAEAAQIIEATEERHHEAELYRLRGDFLNATGDPSGAEPNYHRALAVARSQSAKLLELRASISLARLWCKQGKRGEARNLLAFIYNWFTEGFGTPVLEEAKALLEELAQ